MCFCGWDVSNCDWNYFSFAMKYLWEESSIFFMDYYFIAGREVVLGEAHHLGRPTVCFFSRFVPNREWFCLWPIISLIFYLLFAVVHFLVDLIDFSLPWLEEGRTFPLGRLAGSSTKLSFDLCRSNPHLSGIHLQFPGTFSQGTFFYLHYFNPPGLNKIKTLVLKPSSFRFVCSSLRWALKLKTHFLNNLKSSELNFRDHQTPFSHLKHWSYP